MGSIKHEDEFQVDQPTHILFPLFNAEGEKYWVPGWDYKNMMESSELHEDHVFVTESHGHASGDAVCSVKRRDPDANYVEFYKVEPEDEVGIISGRRGQRVCGRRQGVRHGQFSRPRPGLCRVCRIISVTRQRRDDFPRVSAGRFDFFRLALAAILTGG